ncbi:MAG TPA: hypothetical protein VMU84_16780, partial [Thermoanaerobaculia bacterium]|nr:hypothetical protein [Thermoanaerobaculia bacterium]
TGASTYQWYQRVGSTNTLISGATTFSYRPPTGTRGMFTYFVRVTSSQGCFTDSVLATVNVQ